MIHEYYSQGFKRVMTLAICITTTFLLRIETYAEDLKRVGIISKASQTAFAPRLNSLKQGMMNYGVSGNVPNLAARLSGEANGGQIGIDGKTYARIDNTVEVKPLGKLSIKGFSRKIDAYNILKLSG